jgi:hypothetical protein
MDLVVGWPTIMSNSFGNIIRMTVWWTDDPVAEDKFI